MGTEDFPNVEVSGERLVARRRLRRGAFTEHYLTVAPVQSAGPRDIFAELAGVLAEDGIAPIQERIYGRAGARQEVLAARAAAFRDHGLDPALPAVYVEGEPLRGAATAGVRLWGVDRAVVTTVECPGAGRGRLWRGPGFDFLYLPVVAGLDCGGSPAAQAKRMFLNARAALKSQGFSYCDVARTWIYMRRLLDWYDEFNRVRSSLYKTPDFFGAGAAAILPASTGIQGRVDDEECFMEVLALRCSRSGAVDARPVLGSARQGAAFSYGSAFSRAMSLRDKMWNTIHVSGTASIDETGNTVFAGDAREQSAETLRNVETLLKEQGAGLKDILSATLYCKTEKDFGAYRKAVRRLGSPDFPTVAVLGDVCRPELDVELEAVAAVAAGAPA